MLLCDTSLLLINTALLLRHAARLRSNTTLLHMADLRTDLLWSPLLLRVLGPVGSLVDEVVFQGDLLQAVADVAVGRGQVHMVLVQVTVSGDG